MPRYLVSWYEKVPFYSPITAESEEEAIEKARRGEYEDVDSDGGTAIKNSFKVEHQI